MALTPGTRLGAYEIVSALGAGGMGEVYRARDSKLNREVAIKVLLPAVANDPERLARFSREARVLASLNHPNIAHVYGFEEAAGVGAIVMELVEGPTLADRIAHGPLPVSEALPIAAQIAAALEAAHEQGIIHRDLKPANVKVREDGTVKVLDFGLAKALEPASSDVVDATNSPTLTGATMHGVILGTAAYMSPEQARGKTVDKRADIWAFGVVVFEMLTGTRPFQSTGVSDTLAFILTKDPDWAALPADTPSSIRRLLRHCLAKDHRQRLGDIRDARIEIQEANSTTLEDTAADRPSVTRRERLAWIAAATSALVTVPVVVLLALGVLRLRETAPAAPVVRFTIPPGDAVGISGKPVISPDGRRIVFASSATNALWLRELDDDSLHRLPGTERAQGPFWSPDSRRIGFFAVDQLKTIDVAGGGVPVKLCNALGQFRGGSWGAAGVILFATSTATTLQQIPAAGGVSTPATVIDPAQPGRDSWPQFLPDGHHFLYLGTHEFTGLFVSSLELKVGTPVVRTNTHGAYASGFLLFMSGNDLMRQPFDLGRLRPSGNQAPTVENVGSGRPGDSGEAAFSVSGNGVLVYAEPESREKQRLVWVNRQNKMTPLGLKPGVYESPSLSPDGRRIAVAMSDDTGQNIWVYDIQSGDFDNRTFDGSSAFPLWTPDSQYLTFTRGVGFVGPLMRVRADGSGQAEPLVTDEQRPGQKIATSYSADGKLAFQSGQDVIVREADGALTPVLATAAYEREGRFAPGGRWIAYNSDETGHQEVWVQSYPTGGGRWQISTDGGAQPMWSPKGRELFYKSGNRMMAVPVDVGATFTKGTPHVVFERELPERAPGNPSRFAVTQDGERFLVLTTVPTENVSPTTRPINVILNWPTLAATGLPK